MQPGPGLNDALVAQHLTGPAKTGVGQLRETQREMSSALAKIYQLSEIDHYSKISTKVDISMAHFGNYHVRYLEVETAIFYKYEGFHED